ncbi:MAG: type III pantothenate kinase [Bacteriovorax sp.]|jgi:type III pantothenate kinase
MRIITVDNGNTNPHVGIYQDEQLVSIIPLKDYSPLPDDFILISNVGGPLAFKPSFDLKTKWHNKKFFEMPVNYSETLGEDRLIVAYALFKQLKSSEKILAIDAGTFITMDLIDHSGFSGGFIFPGIQTFLSSYKKGTNLPELDLKQNFELIELPHSTEEAILGAVEIYLHSILKGIIEKTSPGRIVITGGSLEFIKNKILKINSKVQLETNPHLLHSSLFWIYRHHLRLK